MLHLITDVLLSVLAPILIMVAVGALLRSKLRIDVATLGKLNIYLFVPVYVFEYVSTSKLGWDEMAGIFGITVLQVLTLGLIVWAIGRLLGIGWLEWKEIPGPEPEPEAADASNSQPVNGPPEHRENVPEDRESLPVISREGPAEWKGREGKGREEEAPQAAPSVPVMEPPVQKGPRPPKRETFQPPTPDEVEEYARSLGAPDFDGVAFCAYYATRGWVPSGSRAPMKKWRAAVVTWLRRNR